MLCLLCMPKGNITGMADRWQCNSQRTITFFQCPDCCGFSPVLCWHLAATAHPNIELLSTWTAANYNSQVLVV